MGDQDAPQFAPPYSYQTPPTQPGAAWPVQPYPTTPAPRNRKLIFGIVGGAVVLALAGVGAYAAIGGSNSNNTAAQQISTSTATPTASAASLSGSSGAAAGGASAVPISLPDSAGGLVLLTNSLGTAEASRVKSGVQLGGSMYNNVLVGSYGKTASSGYTTVFVIQPLSNLNASDQNEINGISPSDFVNQLSSVVKMTDASDVQTRNSEASMRCGTLTAVGVSVLTCLWMDARTFGLAYFYDTYGATTKAAAARYTDALRIAAEHG